MEEQEKGAVEMELEAEAQDCSSLDPTFSLLNSTFSLKTVDLLSTPNLCDPASLLCLAWSEG